MNFLEIQNLSETLPSNSRSHHAMEVVNTGSRNNKEIDQFTVCYKDTSFLWNYVKSHTDFNRTLRAVGSYVTPATEELMYRAQRFERGGKDNEVAHAVAIDRVLDPIYRHVLQACFMAYDYEEEEVANRLGLPAKVIHIYEKMFFNVLNRKDEHLWLASLAYPEGKLAELDAMTGAVYSNALRLKQAGYENGIDDVLTLAGVRGYAIVDDTKSAVKEFERSMMVNALFLARNGFLNKNHIGISNAKNLIAAAKHGGDMESSTENDDVSTSVGATLMDEVIEVSREELIARQEYVEARKVS